MKINISQQELKWNFKYDIIIDNCYKYIAEANRTILPTKRKVIIRDEKGDVLIQSQEKNMVNKLLLSIPLIGLITSFFIKKPSTYSIIMDDKLVGSIEQIRDFNQPRFEVCLNEKNITVYKFTLGRKGYKYPVYCDGLQIGLIEKGKVTDFNAEKYTAQFDSDSDVICNLLTGVFVDLIFHTKDISTEISYCEVKYEWNLLKGFAKVKYDENWKAK